MALALMAAGASRASASNCSATSVGFIPLNDLGAGSYLGFQGGLYPGGASTRPAAHDVSADLFARLVLLDPNGLTSSAGRIVLLSIGMSNTTQEFSKFVQLEASDPNRNPAVKIVDGAQGGWSADRVVDPNQNATFWTTVDQRLAAAGVTPLQVQAIWLKEADASPTLPFPQDAQKLQGELQTIVQTLKSRYPNTRQVYLSSRIYAGYATSTLNPEPFAYQSGFASKWLIESQLAGSGALNFDPARGPVTAPWLSWGPYLWADGLAPRSDGLIWQCADLQSDGTHPATTGVDKVDAMLKGFFFGDAVARRWFADCAPTDAGAFSVPPDVLNAAFEVAGAVRTLRWTNVAPASGTATVHDIVSGSLSDLRSARSFSAATCAASGLAAASLVDPVADPAVGDGVYYLIRGRNSCGAGTFGDNFATPTPRTNLDATAPCP
ncbi:MAG: hypothetical protein HY049_20215 [Acidobacteria bacterium]|nr:hypothetical protein [Acidobacteriota bacterium]